MVLPTVCNSAQSWLPSSDTAVITTTPSKPTIRPYSMAVAPLSSAIS